MVYLLTNVVAHFKMRITKKTYDLYCKHGSELLWVSDPIRVLRPEGTNKKTDEEFIVLEKLDESMELLYNGNYSATLKKECSDKIERLKSKVTDEVLRLIQNKRRGYHN